MMFLQMTMDKTSGEQINNYLISQLTFHNVIPSVMDENDLVTSHHSDSQVLVSHFNGILKLNSSLFLPRRFILCQIMQCTNNKLNENLTFYDYQITQWPLAVMNIHSTRSKPRKLPNIINRLLNAIDASFYDWQRRDIENDGHL